MFVELFTLHYITLHYFPKNLYTWECIKSFFLLTWHCNYLLFVIICIIYICFLVTFRAGFSMCVWGGGL